MTMDKLKLAFFVTVLFLACALSEGYKLRLSLIPVRRQGAGIVQKNVGKNETMFTRPRTIPTPATLKEDCDYVVYHCLKAYLTGKVCIRANNWNYFTADNFCMVEYLNCMERSDVYQVAYMGECQKALTFNRDNVVHYEYADDFFLDQTYVITS